MRKYVDDIYFLTISRLIEDITTNTIIEKYINNNRLAHLDYGFDINGSTICLYKQELRFFRCEYGIQVDEYKMDMSQAKLRDLFDIFEKKYNELNIIRKSMLRKDALKILKKYDI